MLVIKKRQRKPSSIILGIIPRTTATLHSFLLFRTDILLLIFSLLIIGALGLEISAARTINFNVKIITSASLGYLYS